MIIVDSSVWIAYFNGVDSPQTEKLNVLFSTDRIAVGDLVLTEVLQGYSRKKEFDAALKVLSGFEPLVIGGHKLAVTAARNYVTLRSLGFTIRKTIDTLIATRCIMSGYELLHNDRDFLPFEKHLGLRSVIPTTEN